MTSGPLLAIDTSGPRLQLALARDSVRDGISEEMLRGHAEALFGRIDALLARNALSYPDLARIAVTVGPGSFTGLRIGIAAARGLGLARAIPVIGIPNLLALSLAAESGPVDVAIDARRGEHYVQTFSAPGIARTEPALVPAEAAARYRRPGVRLVTDPVVDLVRMAGFAQTVAPEDFLPVPAYVRQADAKPQQGARIARAAPAS